MICAHVVSIGPEIYHVKKMRSSGSQQQGVLYGIFAAYNQLRPSTIYFGGDVYYASGMLHGANASGRALKSSLVDWQLEGRLGYNFRYLTPFVGYGYLEEQTIFLPPSSTTFHYRDDIQYLAGGFLSVVQLPSRWSVGLYAKVKWMLSGSSHVSNDPDNLPLTLAMSNELQYRVDLPINYHFLSCLFLSAVPFYEYRHYGGHESFPYDFIDTQYQIWGGQLVLSYRF